ncbi:diguanylate cyclase domain-containing protein [Ilumatobacter nonamiensis]|uniref:diguanylate cyclase domain-containing protein n=1 Tax=Ilumatobacter nonamiensis TaxID=467093 RepID=UPI00034A2FC7|nr:diguanylate cyclase [Ilumatobacter nonamiensis]
MTFAGRERDAEYLLRVLDAAPAAVMVIDEDLKIQWTNSTAVDLFGFSFEHAIGRSVLEYIDPDWNPLAFDSVVSALGGKGLRQPMLFRAIAEDGTKTIVEVTANVQLHDELVGGMVVYVRTWDERWLLDQVLHAMASGEPAEHTLGLLVRVAGAETIGAPASLLYDPDGGRVSGIVAAAELPSDLRGPEVGCDTELVDIWAPLLGSAEGRVHKVADLPDRLRCPATDRGYQTLWIWPSAHNDDPLRSAWALAWRREEHTDVDETRRMMMARLGTLVGMIIDGARADAAQTYAAAHDSLTGLLNRAAFHDRLNGFIADVDTDAGAGIGVVYVDLDGFKPINDALGHGAGDRVLVEIAHRLSEMAPAGSILARLGGDEFALACGAESVDALAGLAQDLTERVGEPVQLRSGEAVRVSASAGISYHRGDALRQQTSHRLVDAADQAMYAAKRAGDSISFAAG